MGCSLRIVFLTVQMLYDSKYFFFSICNCNWSLLPEQALLVMLSGNIITLLQDVMIIKTEILPMAYSECIMFSKIL